MAGSLLSLTGATPAGTQNNGEYTKMHYNLEREDCHGLIERGLGRYKAELEAELAAMARIGDDIGTPTDLYDGKATTGMKAYT
jgi:hypothetical protein